MATVGEWGNKRANNREETRGTDAATGKGGGISKTDYSSPRSNNNQGGNRYAEAVAKNANSSSLQGTIDPDRTGAAAHCFAAGIGPPAFTAFLQLASLPRASFSNFAISAAMPPAAKAPMLYTPLPCIARHCSRM